MLLTFSFFYKGNDALVARDSSLTCHLQEMSIASSPPLDLDHVEFVSEESCSQETTNTEFTKVTKKQRKKKSGSIKERPDRTYQSGSAFRFDLILVVSFRELIVLLP